MSDEPHPQIKQIMDAIGSDNHDHVDVVSMANFMQFNHADRTEILRRTAEIAGADDGVQMRKKAQVLDLSRKLRDAHNALRRSGR